MMEPIPIYEAWFSTKAPTEADFVAMQQEVLRRPKVQALHAARGRTLELLAREFNVERGRRWRWFRESDKSLRHRAIQALYGFPMEPGTVFHYKCRP